MPRRQAWGPGVMSPHRRTINDRVWGEHEPLHATRAEVDTIIAYVRALQRANGIE